jgi:4'-phosphopantetheinyl transferase
LSARATRADEGQGHAGFRGFELWCVDLDAAGAALDACERAAPRLSAAECERAASARDAARGAEWRAAHIALRLLIERAAGTEWRTVPFAAGPHGKPQLEGAPVAFSLAHAPGVALVGIAARGTIGVDIEVERAVHMRRERRAPIEAAAQALDAAEPLPAAEDARLLQAWVRLEAWAKAEGCGIGRLLGRLGIVGDDRNLSCDAARASAQALQAASPGMQVRDLALGGGRFAAAATSPAEPLPPVLLLPATEDGLAALLAKECSA